MTTSFLRSYHLSTHLNGAEHTTIEHFFNIFTRTIFFMSKDNGLPIMTGSSQDVLNCFTFYCYYPSWLYPTVVTRSNAHFWCRSRIGLWNPPQSSLLCQFFFLFFLSDLLYLAGKFVTLDRYRILSIPILYTIWCYVFFVIQFVWPSSSLHAKLFLCALRISGVWWATSHWKKFESWLIFEKDLVLFKCVPFVDQWKIFEVP